MSETDTHEGSATTEFVEWTEAFAVGNEELDQEHRKLLDLVATFLNAFDEEKAEIILNAILDELLEFARDHFKREERLLRKFDRAGFIAQKDINDELSKELGMLRDTYADGKLGSKDIAPFLKEWILRHLTTVAERDIGRDGSDD